jgi:predicted phosphodiesterase
MEKSAIVKPYLEKFPDHGDLTLAKLIYKDHSLSFTNVEAARDSVRYYRGHLGKAKRGDLKDKSLVKPVTHNTNPYKLPDSEEKIREPFILPKACNNILLISDLHIPYHSINAITAALDYGKKEEVNTVVINGDLMDFYGCSRFERDPRKRSVKFEFDSTKAFIVTLRHTFPNAQIYWLKGNHDIRYEHYLMAKAPEIFDDPYFSLEERLKLNEERVHLIGDKTILKAGKLSVHHGHLFFRGFMAPVNSARGLFLKAKQSMLCSHVHKVSEHSEVTLGGELITCWSTGCLAELSPDYSPFSNNYSHGFAHIKTDNSGNYSVSNYRIYKGKIVAHER